jgi:hypothetical protein
MNAWADRAACRDWLNPEDFFPKSGDPPRRVKEACAGCPVRSECFEWAIKHERHGWWSNTGEEYRDAYRKRHGIQLDPISIWPDSRPNRTPPDHGTLAAARRHRRRGEPLCHKCIRAERDDTNRRAAQKRERERTA